eukprot:2737859-Rhodomonas_salina.1
MCIRDRAEAGCAVPQVRVLLRCQEHAQLRLGPHRHVSSSEPTPTSRLRANADALLWSAGRVSACNIIDSWQPGWGKVWRQRLYLALGSLDSINPDKTWVNPYKTWAVLRVSPGAAPIHIRWFIHAQASTVAVCASQIHHRSSLTWMITIFVFPHASPIPSTPTYLPLAPSTLVSDLIFPSEHALQLSSVTVTLARTLTCSGRFDPVTSRGQWRNMWVNPRSRVSEGCGTPSAAWNVPLSE